MDAEYLFIMNHSNQNQESVFAANDLFGKYSHRARRTVLISGFDDDKARAATGTGNGPWAHKVGIYAVSDANVALKGGEGPSFAVRICDFLDSQYELYGIRASDLGKIVIVTCNAADRLKRDVLQVDSVRINRIANESQRVAEYNKLEDKVNKELLSNINEIAADYSKDDYKNKASLIKSSIGADLRLFACALAEKGVFPKIGAWDSGLFVRSDGKKSIKKTAFDLENEKRINIVDGPEMTKSRRLVSKVMFTLKKGDDGQLSGVLLDERAWTDKPMERI